MTEAELRALVRDAIAQHLGGPGTGGSGIGSASGGLASAALANAAVGRGHVSHVMFAVPSGDGACLIEPAVACNHCGYCKSYGH